MTESIVERVAHESHVIAYRNFIRNEKHKVTLARNRNFRKLRNFDWRSDTNLSRRRVAQAT